MEVLTWQGPFFPGPEIPLKKRAFFNGIEVRGKPGEEEVDRDPTVKGNSGIMDGPRSFLGFLVFISNEFENRPYLNNKL